MLRFLLSRVKSWAVAGRLSSGIVRLCKRRPGAWVVGFVLLGLLSAWPISGLSLRTDFTELLPKTHPAVQAIREVLPRQISSTNLVLIVESPDPAQNRRFAEALRPKFQALVGSLFSEITVEPDTEIADAAARHKWHYAELSEIREANALLERLLGQRSNPLLVDLEGDAEAELRKIRADLAKRLPTRDGRRYFEFHPATQSETYPDPHMHHLGIMLWRRGAGLASLDDQDMLDAVQAVVSAEKPQTFHPKMRIEWTGQVAMALSEQRAVRTDLTLASSLTVLLSAGLMYAHFRRLALVALSVFPAFLGVLFSLSVARYTYSYLNANTAFLVAIILGNGINTAIVLLSRYREERWQGRDAEEALCLAMTHTLRSTFSAALSASVAYGALLFTTLQGLSQFGLVGGVGMLFCFALTFLCLPPLLLWCERHVPLALAGKQTPPLFGSVLQRLGRSLSRSPRTCLAACGLSVFALLPALLAFVSAPLEYDFSKLRTQDKHVERLWQRMYDLGLGNVGAGFIGRDGVMLAETQQKAERVAQALRAQDAQKGEARVLEAVRTLESVLPTQQTEKIALLTHMRDTLDRYRKLISEEEWQELREVRPPDDLRPLLPQDLPKKWRDAFTEVDGQVGRLIGIDADPKRFRETDGRELIRLSRSLSVKVDGKRYVAASVSTLFAAMLEVIQTDGPRLLLRCFSLSCALLFLMFGVRAGWPVLLSLGVGLLWLLGGVALLGWKLNFLNFVALPITIGIGMEYATNLWARFVQEGGIVRTETIVRETGSAVCLCSLTTVVGYGTLLLSQNRALQTFGAWACLGEVSCLFAALLVIPALFQVSNGNARKDETAPKPESPEPPIAWP
ncbi:MAG TPA: MMPL family transporter [Pseudomonadota bacterium]|nr:MMPL family transporter [Pseudomonadota bacterium]